MPQGPSCNKTKALNQNNCSRNYDLQEANITYLFSTQLPVSFDCIAFPLRQHICVKHILGFGEYCTSNLLSGQQVCTKCIYKKRCNNWKVIYGQEPSILLWPIGSDMGYNGIMSLNMLQPDRVRMTICQITSFVAYLLLPIEPGTPVHRHANSESQLQNISVCDWCTSAGSPQDPPRPPQETPEHTHSLQYHAVLIL